MESVLMEPAGVKKLPIDFHTADKTLLRSQEERAAEALPANSLLQGALSREEEKAARRYASSPLADSITYEFTDDKALLHQYFRVRVQAYRHVHGFADFDYEPDEYDRMSHILIARIGKLCIGGARLTVREPDESWRLPMETDGFSLRDSMPELELHKNLHSEVSRFAIMDDYNTKEVLYQVSLGLNQRALELGVEYGFCRSPLLLARNWRKINNVIGMYHADILWNANVPQVSHSTHGTLDEEVKMYLVQLSRVAEFPKRELKEVGRKPVSQMENQ